MKGKIAFLFILISLNGFSQDSLSINKSTDSSVLVSDQDSSSQNVILAPWTSMTLGPWCCSEYPPFDFSKFVLSFSTLNKEGALNDIKEKNIKILYREGMISVNFKTEKHKVFEKLYAVKFYTQGCTRTIGDDEAGYNSVIFDYLDKKYGLYWRLQVPQGVIGLEKLDQCKAKIEVDFCKYNELVLNKRLLKKKNAKQVQKNKKRTKKFDPINYFNAGGIFLLLLFVIYKLKNRKEVRF